MNRRFYHLVQHHILKHKIVRLRAKPRVLQCHICILLYPEKFVLHLAALYDTHVILQCLLQFKKCTDLLINQQLERGNRRLNLVHPHGIICGQILLAAD